MTVQTLADIHELAQQLRVDSVRCSTAAGSGHPTSSMSAADLMARWTNDRWRSTLHRVVDPGAAARRQSMAYFQNANWSARISCLPTCLEPGEKPRYAPVLAGPHLMGKFRRSVGL